MTLLLHASTHKYHQHHNGSAHHIPRPLTLTSVTPETPQQTGSTTIQTEIFKVREVAKYTQLGDLKGAELRVFPPFFQKIQAYVNLLSAGKPKEELISHILYYSDRAQNVTGPNLQKGWLPDSHTNSLLVHSADAGHLTLLQS